MRTCLVTVIALAASSMLLAQERHARPRRRPEARSRVPPASRRSPKRTARPRSWGPRSRSAPSASRCRRSRSTRRSGTRKPMASGPTAASRGAWRRWTRAPTAQPDSLRRGAAGILGVPRGAHGRRRQQRHDSAVDRRDHARRRAARSAGLRDLRERLGSPGRATAGVPESERGAGAQDPSARTTGRSTTRRSPTSATCS